MAGPLKRLAQVVLTMVLWGVLLSAGAGRLDWWLGWICTAIYVCSMVLVGMIVHHWNHGLLEARSRWRVKDAPPFDKVFQGAFTPLTFVQILVSGLDAGRFRWLPLPAWMFAPGTALFLLSMGLLCWTLVMNPFAETTVRIQADRGHYVVQSGPYRFVRHPMYVSLLALYPATALMLGSGWALIVAVPIDLLVVWRTAREDGYLRAGLEGYPAYAAKTRFRLLPGIW